MARWEWMSPVDAAWLRMDGPTNPMMITVLMLFERPLPAEVVVRVVRDKLLRADRFRQLASETGLGLPRWEEDPHFDLRNHVRRVGLPAPGGEAELRELVADLLSSRLDRRRPLWDVHVVEGVQGGTAVITRLHHAIGDGVALVKLLLTLIDDDTAPPPPEVGVTPPVAEGFLDVARLGAARARSLADMLLLPGDSETPLRGRLGPRKGAAWSAPLPLPALKALARDEGGKVHDVLAALVAGALRRHLEELGAMRPGLEVRALVPVNVKAERNGDLGNHFGLVYLPLPLHLDDPRERLRETRRRMDVIKNTPQALVALEVLGAMGLVTAGVERFGVELFSAKATAMMTTVPGPTETVHLSGVPLTGFVVFAPGSGQVGLQVTHLSYAGAVRVGVSADAGLLPDPAALVRALHEERGALGF